MFGWLFGARRRQIFKFYDGIRSRTADPLHVWAMLQSDPKLEMERHVKELKSPLDQVSATALLVIEAAVRRAFEVPQFVDGGLTAQECVELLLAYDLWLADQKKTSNPSRISPQPMDSCPLGSGSITG